MCAYVYACSYECGYTCVQLYMGKPEVRVRCLAQPLFPILLRLVSLWPQSQINGCSRYPAHPRNFLSLPPKGGTAGHCPAGFLYGFWGSEPWSSGLHRQHFIHRAFSPASFVSFPQLSPKNAPSTEVGSCLASLMCQSFPGRAKQPLHLINFNHLSADVLCVWIVLSASL